MNGEKLTNARPQIIHPQINRAQFGKSLQTHFRRFVHVLGCQACHHRGTANRIEHRADHTTMNAVVGKVPYQRVLHVDARRHHIRHDRCQLQTQSLVEDNFFFVNFSEPL